MTALTFDTHAFVKRLQGVGFSLEQAEVFAEEQTRFVEERLASKADLLDMEERLRRELRELDLSLQLKLAHQQTALIRWVVAVGLLQITLIAGLLLRLTGTA